MKNENELENKIVGDLKKSGYLSEMLSLHAFNKRKWDASGNVVYFDLDEHKSREGDLHAEYRVFHKLSEENEIECGYHVIAEVKKTETPWIIFKEKLGAGNDTEFRRSFVDLWGNLIAYKNLPAERPDYNPFLQEHSIAYRNGWVGVGVHESFKPPQEKSKWYNAAVSAHKAASHLFSNFTYPCENNHVDDLLQHPTYFKIARPLIILDGPLYVSELDHNGEPVVEKCLAACLAFEYCSGQYEFTSSDLDIVTLEYLTEYICLCEQRLENIMKAILSFGRIAI